MALSCVVSEIFNVEKYSDRDLEIPVKSQSRSLKLVPFDNLGTRERVKFKLGTMMHRCIHTTLLPGTSVTTASRSRMLPLAVNYDPPAAIKLSFPATTRARSAVGPSLSPAQWSGTHCQTSSATHRHRLTVSVASLKHSCLQTRINVHSVSANCSL